MSRNKNLKLLLFEERALFIKTLIIAVTRFETTYYTEIEKNVFFFFSFFAKKQNFEGFFWKFLFWAKFSGSSLESLHSSSPFLLPLHDQRLLLDRQPGATLGRRRRRRRLRGRASLSASLVVVVVRVVVGVVVVDVVNVFLVVLILVVFVGVGFVVIVDDVEEEVLSVRPDLGAAASEVLRLDPEEGRLPVPELEVAPRGALVPLVDLDPEPGPLFVGLVLAENSDLETIMRKILTKRLLQLTHEWCKLVCL